MNHLKWAGPAAAALLAAACGDGYDNTREADDARAGQVTGQTGETTTAGTAQTGQPDRGAEQALNVTVRETAEYGRYLADGNGRPLYIFTADTAASGSGAAKLGCTGQCLDAWPPAMTAGQPMAGSGVNSSLLGSSAYDGGMVATYGGWPLYYFARDGGGAGDPMGQKVVSFGGEWYLVTPEGMKIGAEQE